MDKKKLLNILDNTISTVALNTIGERKGLSTFLFHGVYKDDSEKSKHHIFPQENLTVKLFRQFLDYFQLQGYQFIGPEDITSGKLSSDINYGLITFDDGYCNNTLIVEVLEEYKVPAVFFVPTSFIQDGDRLWSDIVHYERTKRNFTDAQILEEIKHLRSMRLNKIKDYIIEEFGPNAFRPLSDIDRFLNEEELRKFAQSPYVHIGNHTHSHEALTLLSKVEIEWEFQTSQNLLTQFLGKKPFFVSYPYGSYSNIALAVAKGHGLNLGITTVQKKNYLPLNSSSLLLLNRFNPIAENGALSLKKFQSPIQTKTLLKKWLQ